jgi:hypothetical protein
MKTFVLSLSLAVAAAACSGSTPSSPSTFVVPLVATSTDANTGSPLSNTHLTGEHENPANTSQGQGEAILKVSADRLSVSYKLIASNIDNIVQSHIHVGSPTVNGPIVVFLYGLVPAGGGRHDGVLAEGTFTAANLIGPLAGHPLADLLSALEAGNTYVNVHTNDGVAPTNTGPGDFPGGEIRGQISAKK